MDTAYYPYHSYGRIAYDLNQGHKRFEPGWAFVMVDRGLLDYYSWHLLKWGIPLERSVLWGPHISIIKGDRESPSKEGWGKKLPRVKFYHSNIIRWDNGVHAWLDVYSDDINEIRVNLGLAPKSRFHVTLGRLR